MQHNNGIHYVYYNYFIISTNAQDIHSTEVMVHDCQEIG